jgi:chorismate dehydratase
VRIGGVPYLAGRPCIEGLDRDPRFDLTVAPPAELVAQLRGGALDAALVSSIEAFRRPGYRYVPSVGIVADGEVRSVLLFARRELAACATLALDPASRSGAALAQVCLAEERGSPVRIVEVQAGADPARAGADVYLRIGDAALRALAAREAEPHDLATLWKRRTGLPFVFAVWLVRPDARLGPEHVAAIVAARDRGVARRGDLARAGAAELGLPEPFVHSYLTEACRYDLDAPGAMDGWREFRRRAAALGLCDESFAPPPVSV